jgi:multiple sugar transport system permease protein
MLSASVRSATEINQNPIDFLPSVWRWENYTAPWADYPFTAFYRNSVVITTLSVCGTLFTGSLVAFAFARMRFRGRGFLFVLVLSTMMLPSQVTLIPIYVLWSKLQLVNTMVPLIVPSFFGGEYAYAFSVFLLRQYMLSIPLEIDDAARIDGATWFQIYWRVIVPMSAPALGAVAIYNFTAQWNDFLKPLVYLNTPENFTVQLGLALLNGRFDSEIGQVMAQTTLSILPMVIVFFFAQRNYVQGNVVSGVKG